MTSTGGVPEDGHERDVLIDCMTSFDIRGDQAALAADYILSADSGLVVTPSTNTSKPVVTVTLDGAPVFVGSPGPDSYLEINADANGVTWLSCRVPYLLAQLEVSHD